MGKGGEKSRRQAGEMSSPEGRRQQAKGRSRDPGYTVSPGLGEHFLSWETGVYGMLWVWTEAAQGGEKAITSLWGLWKS